MSAVLDNPRIEYRPMQVADLPRVLEIEHGGYDYPWTEGIFKDCLRVGYCCWLLIEDENIMGYAIMSIGAGEAHILNICIDKTVQRKNYATILMEHMLSISIKRNSESCLLEVRPSNLAALALYDKLGFTEVGVRKNYYPANQGKEDAIILAKQTLFDE